MPTRRGFLGSIIGIVGGYVFYAKGIDESPNKLLKYYESVYPYRMSVVDSTYGHEIQAPPIELIEYDKESNSLIFKCYKIEIRRTLALDKMRILDSDGSKIVEYRFDGNYNVMPGDTIQLTYSFDYGQFDGSKFSVEETIEFMKRMKA